MGDDGWGQKLYQRWKAESIIPTLTLENINEKQEEMGFMPMSPSVSGWAADCETTPLVPPQPC